MNYAKDVDSPIGHISGLLLEAASVIEEQAKLLASIAQLVEQRTFNPWVAGSSPAGGTIQMSQYTEKK